VFYNDRNSFQTLLELMRSEHDRFDPASALMYHINLVQLLALCTEGKNVYTEIKCHSLLPLDDIVRVVMNADCVPEVTRITTVITAIIFIFQLPRVKSKKFLKNKAGMTWF